MTPKKVIRAYLIITGIYNLSASLIWGVNTLFLLAAGLNIFQVFVANAVFTASMALFEIPTGVLADTRGRRTSFLLSVLVVMLGTLGYVAASVFHIGLWLFIVMSVVLGLGYTFYSGAVEAWLVDALNASGYEGNLDVVFSRGAMVFGVAMLIGTVGGGALGTINLAIPFVLRAVLLAAVFGVSFFMMHDLGFSPRPLNWATVLPEMRTVAQDSLRFGWGKPTVRLLMATSFVLSAYMMWGFYAWQPYFLDLLGEDAPWVAGVVAALISLSTIAGNALTARFSGIIGRRTTVLIGAGAVMSLATVAVGLTGSFWIAVGLFLLTMMMFGMMQPVKQSYLHSCIPGDKRATVVSFDSLVGSGGSVLGQMGLGWLSQNISIASGYVVGGAFTLLAIPVLGLLRRFNEPADFFAPRQISADDDSFVT